MVTQDAVLDALRTVKDPDVQQDIVSLGLIRDLAIAESQVSFTLAFTTQSPASRATMHSMASRAVGRVPGVSKVQVKMGSGQAARPPQAAHAHGHAHGQGPSKAEELIPEVKQTIAENVSSGPLAIFNTVATTHNQVGWTAGAGIEAALWGNWTAKAEYLYLDLGTVKTTIDDGGPPVGVFGRVDTTSTVRAHIFRAGVNYRFSGMPDRWYQ